MHTKTKTIAALVLGMWAFSASAYNNPCGKAFSKAFQNTSLNQGKVSALCPGGLVRGNTRGCWIAGPNDISYNRGEADACTVTLEVNFMTNGQPNNCSIASYKVLEVTDSACLELFNQLEVNL